MAREVKYRRGSTADHAGFTGASGELTIDTDKHTAVVHDGATAGGFPLAREDGVGTQFVQSSYVTRIIILLQAAYDALVTKDPNTLYYIIPPTVIGERFNYTYSFTDCEFAIS